MGERKVLNKYYPPDFDPSKLPRIRRPKNQQIKVRMMLPMSIRCNTCGNYIYKGTKFNSRKEDVIGEKYLDIQVFRFYFKCTKCSAELSMKTDPKNSDYVVESGATRNFEPWREEDEVVDSEKRKREAEEMGDAMKGLENRTLDSKREMDGLAALDEMKSMKSRHATVSVESMLEALQRSAAEKVNKLDEEDEALIKSYLLQKQEANIRRINDEDLDDDDDVNLVQHPSRNGETSSNYLKRKKVSQEIPVNPTDVLTNANVPDSSSNREKPSGSEASSDAKSVLKFPPVRISIVKKPVVATENDKPRKPGDKIQNGEDGKDLAKLDEKKQVENNTNVANSGLQSLCYYDDSDEE
ncbi:hypothetical protein FNV43_RR18222 [Rhamnella rubrinervis]|uniref:Splicing factor YJU2 n=1 Tax=Rhamnella rubrinervis TaxID=2594499 RepID=A0A8K0GVJ0_9ROSA|nr:hypothetical protein FNV43_RR18222 [Rhamnella rubrinervis]